MPDINILVVDDEKEIADLIEIYLVSDGYKVFKAENAEAGLSILDKQDIHLVLLDIMMPGMNGLEMCRKIRETNNIPIGTDSQGKIPAAPLHSVKSKQRCKGNSEQ